MFELSRFAGVQVFLQGVLGGGGLILPDEQSRLAEQISVLAANGCGALSASPTMWRKILMLEESCALELQQVTLGGEIADAAVLEALSHRFPAARIVHVYASTETGVGFSVRDGLAGFPRDYLNTTHHGARLRIVDGRLFVHIQSEPSRFENGFRLNDEEGFVDTGDLVELVGDRYYFRGRANGAINVGGNKLYPEEVERILLSDERVSLARVFARASPITGQLVVAEIVSPSQKKRSDLAAELMSLCRDRLQRWQVPAVIRVVDEIQVNAGGKVQRAQS